MQLTKIVENGCYTSTGYVCLKSYYKTTSFIILKKFS